MLPLMHLHEMKPKDDEESWKMFNSGRCDVQKRTTECTTTRKTPFAMAYGYEAMLSMELEPPSYRRLMYNQETNHVLLAESLDEIE
uniref:Uncharacterized protein n=1 Tax=Cannabis sativa TaxID=3483 RepID=A0A803PL66_CANSA